jgi:Ca2+/Na+ antiporter
MSSDKKNLGRLVAVHTTSPAQLQRAVFISVLSFLFFMAMMFAFYLRQNIGYFLLATAFLLVYVVTMFSWIRQRRTVVEIYDNGLKFRGRTIVWSDITAIEKTFVLSLAKGEKLQLPTALDRSEELFSHIQSRISV